MKNSSRGGTTASTAAGSTTRGRTRRPAETIEADHHAHGYLALSPLMLLMMIAICAVAYFVFSQLQIAATEQAVLNILQSGEVTQPGLTTEQIQQFMSGELDRYQTIADGIGWSVQLALTLIAFPPHSLLLSLHRRYNEQGTSVSASATKYFKFRRFCSWALIGGDFTTDFLWVIANHTILTWTGYIPHITVQSAGVLMVGILYPVAICFVTIFVGRYMFVFLEGLINELRRGASAA
jgi:hypothetical protein